MSEDARLPDRLPRPGDPTADVRRSAFEASALSELPGTRIGNYKILQAIGEGGFGSVFMAEQEAPVHRKIALKIIKPGMDTKEVIARFEAERQALAMMDHPNIARVLDAGATESGRPYFVMELVKGEPITEYCDKNSLRVPERLDLFVQLCHAVQHAHQKGVIHRDLKPSNILVSTQDGRPLAKVIDFGIAKATASRLTQKTLFTSFHQLIGTPEYMSPEQAEGSLDIDTRTDIYSLGVLLYELLTGTTPFDAKQLRSAAHGEIQRIIREVEPPRPSTRLSSLGPTLAAVASRRRETPQTLCRLVTRDLDWIVMKCLEKDRARRFDTTNDLALDIQRYLNDEPVVARPASAGYRLWKFTRRNKGLLASAATVLAVLLAGITGTTVGLVEFWRQRDVAQAALGQAEAERDRAVAAEGDASKQRDAARESERIAQEERNQARAVKEKLRRTLYGSQMNLVQIAWDADNVGRVVELLAEQIPGTGEADLRGFEWHYWQRLCNAGLRTVKFPVPASGLGWSRVEFRLSQDGALMGALETAGGLHVWSTENGKELLSVPSTPRGEKGSRFVARGLVFSPDGSQFAVARGRIEGTGMQARRGTFEVALWDLRDGKVRNTFAMGSASYPGGLVFSPDGRLLAGVLWSYSAEGPESSEVKVWEASSGREMFAVKVVGLAADPTFSPDGERIAFTASSASKPGEEPNQTAVRILDASSGKDLLELKASLPGLGSNFAFSPDGARIAGIGSSSGEEARLHVWDASSGNELFSAPMTTRGVVSQMLFSRDGKRLVAASRDQTARVWDGASGKLLLTLKGHTDFISDLALSSGGEHLYSIASDGTLKVWDVVSQGESAEPRPQRPAYRDARVSPDGRRIVRAQNRSSFNEAGELKIVELTGKENVSFKTAPGHSHGMAFSPSGKRFGAIWHLHREDEVYELRVWDVDNGQELLHQEAEVAAALNGVAFSPDGLRVASAVTTMDKDSKTEPVRGGARVWDVASGKEVFSLERGIATFWGGLAFSPDGTRLALLAGRPDESPAATGQETTVFVWDASSGSEVLILKAAGVGGSYRTPAYGGSDPAFSPSGALLAAAVGSWDKPGEVLVWELDQRQTAAPRLRLRGHNGRIECVGFSPDGERICSAAVLRAREGGEVKVWDATTGQELLTLKAHDFDAASTIFSADGLRLLAARSSPREPGHQLQVWEGTPLPEAR